MWGAEKVREFDHNGFVIERSLLSGSEVDEISLHLDRMCGLKPSESSVDRYFEESLKDGGKVLVRIEDFIESDPMLATILLGPKVISRIKLLMGGEVTLFKDKINFKPPGCSEDTIHYDQNAVGWARYAKLFITVAIAIDPNRKENAAMRFLDGGAYRRQLMSSPLRALSPDEFSDDEFVLIAAEPGDAIFFDSYVPHTSPANLSEFSRRNILLTFNRLDAGDHRRRYFEDIRNEYS